MVKYRVNYLLNEVLWTVTAPAESELAAVAAVPAEAEVLTVQQVA